MGLLRLLADALVALVRPGRAFSRIGAQARPPYVRLAALVAAWGVPYAILHFRFMEGQWMRLAWPLLPIVRARLLAFVSVSLMNWLLAGVVVALIARLARRPMPQGRCDVAGFYLWMVWALMPLADSAAFVGFRPWSIVLPFPHDVPLILIGHAAWFFAFPLLVVELLCCARFFLGLSWGRGAGALLLAVFLVVAARMLVEPMPGWVVRGMGTAGHRLDPWVAHTILACGVIVLMLIVRWALRLRATPTVVPSRRLARRRQRLAGTLAAMAAGCFLMAGPAWAVTVTWDGGGTDGTCGGAAGDGNKATCAANWSGDVAPVSGDDIVFNGTSTKNCTFNIDLTGYYFNTVSLNAGYTGTVTLSTTVLISGALTLVSGTFDTASNHLNSANFAQSGGVFNANSSTYAIPVNGFVITAGTFNAGNSTITLSGSSGAVNDGGNTLKNVTVSAGTYTLTAPLDLNGILTIDGGTLNTGGSSYAVNAVGFNQTSGTFTANNSTVTIAGASGNYFTQSGGVFAGGGSTVVLNSAAGSANLQGTGLYKLTLSNAATYTLTGTLTLSDTLTLSAGALDTSSSGNYALNAGSIALSGGTLTANNSAITITGSSGTWNKTAGTFTAGGSTVTLQGQGTLTPGGSSFNHLTINSTGTYTLGGALTANGALTMAGGTLDTSAASSYAVSCASYLQTGGTFTKNNSTMTVSTGDFNLGAGTFSAGTNTLTVSVGSFINAGTFTPSTSTVTLQGSGKLLRSGGAIFNNLTVNASGTYTLDDALAVSGTFTLSAGGLNTNSGVSYPVAILTYSQGGGTFTANASTITLTGAFTITAGTFTAGTSTVKLTSSIAQTFTPGGQSLYNLTVQSLGTYTLGGALTVSNALTVASGAFNTSAVGTYAVAAGSYTQTGGTCVPNGSTITITSGDFTKTAGVFTASVSTLAFSGGNAQVFTPGGSAYYNVTVNKSGSSVTLAGNLTVSNVLTLTAGDLSGSTYTIFLDKSGTGVSRPLIVTAGATFTANSSTVVHRGATTTEVAPLQYYTLVIDQPGVQYNFVANNQTWVSGRLILLGASGNNMTLRSSSTGVQASLIPNSSGTAIGASFLDVADINSCTTGITAENSTNSTGNGCWTFAAASKTWDGGGTDGTCGGVAGDGNKATCAANWSGDTVPVAGNSILFDATSTKSCTFDIDLAGYEFGTFTIASGYTGTVTLASDLSLSTSLFSLAAGTFNSGTYYSLTVGQYKQTGGTFTAGPSLTDYGSFNISSGTFTAGSGTVYLYGSPRINSGGNTLNAVIISGGNYILAGALTVTNGLTIDGSSKLDTSTSNYALTIGSGILEAGGTLTLNQSTMQITSVDFANGGTIVPGSSSFQFTGSGPQTFYTGGATLSSFSVNKTNGSTLTLAGDVTVKNALILAQGVLNASSYRINIDRSGTSSGRPFGIPSGTFTAGTGTVAYRGGATTELAATTYYNLEIEQPGVQFNFLSGATTTVTNAVTLRGNSDRPLFLRSSTGGIAATFNPPDAQTVEYVDVSYNNADAAADGCATNSVTAYNSVNSLNNTCWTFSTTRPRQNPGVGYPEIH